MRRRVAAAAAIALGTATLVAVVAATVRDPGAGLLALAGLAVAAWLTWRGAAHGPRARAPYLCGAALVIGAAVVALAARGQLLAPIVVGAGAVLAASMVRIAFGRHGPAGGGWKRVPAPERPVLLINPHSGDGKAERVALVERARAHGVETVLLEPGRDLAQLARDAVARGADALGMAGGDGSLGIVAAVAATHGLPFVCIPAGTRNHLALDLGVDRSDPVGALAAFTDGVERRIDLADVNGRIFVNNVSLGIYGDAVQRTTYRQAKVRTLLAETLGTSGTPPPLRLVDDRGHHRADAAVLLISNNPYAVDRVLGRATRPRVDGGRLGVVLVGRPGEHAEPLRAWAAPALDVAADGPVPAAADGEAVTLGQPLRFRTHPAALRVRISAHHPGLSPSALLPATPLATVTRLARIAAGHG